MAQAPRPLARAAPSARQLVRPQRTLPLGDVSTLSLPSSSWSGFQPDPYTDYGRFLTPEGGILIVFKDIDVHLRHTLWRLLAWTASFCVDGWYLLHYSPVQNLWLNLACLLAVGVINWLIVRKPVEVYRRVEIRPDCMIIEGADVFWLRFMENAWPALQRDEDGKQLLCGIYGTRFVEYLTLHRFDELDRMDEVFAAHLQEAMMQLWAKPQEFQHRPGASLLG